ncbi:MAG: beta-galactosidase [Sphingomonadales bacterium]|nr:beta-galactosidase [Sphingomonadales bacterium]
MRFRNLAWLPLVLCASAGQAAEAPQAAALQAQQSARQSLNLAEGWRFRFGEAGEAPAGIVFDDSGWDRVSVPHSWDVLGEYALKRSADKNNAQGVGWYRLTVDAPPASSGQRQYLDFAAVGAIADVWVNGVHVGQHKGAFTRFRFDVTAQWKPGAANVVAVRADNSKPAVGSSTEDVIPLAGDFFVHGGIYRGVSLITANEAGIDLLDFGGPGVYARTSEVTEGQAFVEVVTRLRNGGTRARTLTVVSKITDDAGAEVAARSVVVPIKAGATGLAAPTLNLLHPHIWNGRADPYLYSVTSEVWDRKRLVDRVTQPLGVRSFRMDPNEGFFLNGKYLKLHGVSRHQDREGKGWALTPADHAEDMALIAELGANTIRQAHYKHADEWSAEADKAGMVVWSELPYVTTPSLRGGQGSPALWANAEQQLRETIRQNYNHPSIMMWSIGNEVDAAKGFGVKGDPPKPLALLQHLNQLAKQEDPTRPTTFADCCEEVGMMQTAGEDLAGTADLIGYNRYYGWYYPKPLDARAELAAQMDHFHAKHPALPISISEYGAGGAVSQHSDNVRTGFLNFTGRPQPEEFESFVHEENWPVIRDRKFIFASWVWNMFDFASDLREEGDSVDLNTKGLVTDDRKTKKDAFYYYQAQWSDRPMIHLTGKRYAERAYPVMEVKAYSNAPRAALTWNGQALGEVACGDGVCRWPNVALRAGANAAVVTAQNGATDSATWTGPDSAKGIFVEAGDLAGHIVAGKRFGSDNFVTGGAPMVLNMGGFGGRRLAPPRSVAAPEPELYDFWREGEAFSYLIPVPNGKWQVTIHTFEPRPAADPVTMTVRANGKVALAPFNVKQAAGGTLKGIARSFPVTIKDGVLRLDFAGSGGKAVVAAIEVSK